MTSPFDCETCFDTKLIDSGGREIDCPDCVGDYHPRAVTVVANPKFGESNWDRRWHVIDRSYGKPTVYATSNVLEEAEAFARRRRGVIKAALTRRANKARKEAAR